MSLDIVPNKKQKSNIVAIMMDLLIIKIN